MEEAIAVLRQQGAVIVDPANIPSVVDGNPNDNFLLWGICGQAGEARGEDDNCSIVFKYGMKRDFNAWLRTLGDRAPLKPLNELRQANLEHPHSGGSKLLQLL